MPKMEMPKDDVSFEWKIFTLCLLIVVGGGSIFAYTTANNAGWIQHTRTVDLLMEGNWLQNENRKCVSLYDDIKGNTAKMTQVICPDTAGGEKPHNIPIKFWGKVEQPKMADGLPATFWRCTRKGDDFTCYALD
jgi:hypothetical protein